MRDIDEIVAQFDREIGQVPVALQRAREALVRASARQQQADSHDMKRAWDAAYHLWGPAAKTHADVAEAMLHHGRRQAARLAEEREARAMYNAIIAETWEVIDREFGKPRDTELCDLPTYLREKLRKLRGDLDAARERSTRAHDDRWVDEQLSPNWHSFKRGRWRASCSRYGSAATLWRYGGESVAQTVLDNAGGGATDERQVSALLSWADSAIEKLEQAPDDSSRNDRVVAAAEAYVVGEGPCPGADDGQAYCDEAGCTYCVLARSLDVSNEATR